MSQEVEDVQNVAVATGNEKGNPIPLLVVQID